MFTTITDAERSTAEMNVRSAFTQVSLECLRRLKLNEKDQNQIRSVSLDFRDANKSSYTHNENNNPTYHVIMCEEGEPR